jgi:hypothetical protein
MTQTMRHPLKIFVMFVAAAVVVGTLTAGAMPHRDSAVQDAGCHSHHKTPDAPITYQCCQNGHDSALVQSAEAGLHGLILVSTCALSFEPPRTQTPISRTCSTEYDSGEPPGISPLRI